MKRAKCFCPKKEKKKTCAFIFLIKVCHEIFFSLPQHILVICTFERIYFLFHRVGHGKKGEYFFFFLFFNFWFSFRIQIIFCFWISWFLLLLCVVYLFFMVIQIDFQCFLVKAKIRVRENILLYLYSPESFFCSLLLFFCMKPRFAWLNIHIIKFYRFWMFDSFGLLQC